ncbi:MAG TPA: response regulator [Acidimicrobiales bacterium]|nr:response regulator [Acidimicrobiales bacterium]
MGSAGTRQDETATPGATVLIVEDNDTNLKLARDLLRIGGFATLEATTAEQGVELTQRDHPDVVVMDIQLPDFDGWEALRRIREDPLTQDQVVVAVTAYAVAGDEPRFLSGGFDGYLTKPIDVRTFSTSIRSFCRGR